MKHSYICYCAFNIERELRLRKIIFKSTLTLLVFGLLLTGVPWPQSFAASQDVQPPTATLSTRTVAYHGNATPGYVTIDVKTQMPTRGEISVSGPKSTRIVLSTMDYKTEHIVNWAPCMEDGNKTPLPPGVYNLTINMTDQNSNQYIAGAGTITVVAESNPKAAIDSVFADKMVISPKYNSTDPLTTIHYQLNRPAEVQPVVYLNSTEYPIGQKQTLAAGPQTFAWNGRDTSNKILQDSDYSINFKVTELCYNYPNTKPDTIDTGYKISVKDGEFGLPQFRLQQIVSSAGFNDSAFTPNGDGAKDTVSGTVTLTEKIKDIRVYVANSYGIIVKNVYQGQNLNSGTYSFIWDGNDFMGGKSYDGTYYMGITITDSSGLYGTLEKKDTTITIKDSYPITIPQPEQRARIIVDSSHVPLCPYYQGNYYAKKGDTFPISGFSIDNLNTPGYWVKVADGVVGYVTAKDVEIANLDTIPVQWGQTTKAGISAYEGPRDSYQVIEQLQANAKLRIIRQDDVWYRVLLDSGKQAYVKVSDLAPVNDNATVYSVAAGDTLWKIAQKFGVTIDSIVKANNLDASKYLTIGQKLTIPASVNNTVYTVVAGDTLWKIAAKYNVTVNDIVKANNLDVNGYLSVGQKLSIPSVSKIYTVHSGDTLWKIAQKYNTTVQNIAQLNQIDPNKAILIGQQLKVS